MDEIIVRPRYPRNNIQNRKKRRGGSKETNSIMQSLAVQTVLSIVILLLVGILRGVDTPVTNFMTEKIKEVMAQNIDVKNYYTEIDKFIKQLTDKKVVGTNDGFDESSVRAKSDVNSSEGENTSRSNMQGEEASDSSGKISNEAVSQESEDGNSTGEILFITPVSGFLSSYFGERISPTQKTPEFHKGIDIDAEQGDLVKAALAGEVVEAENERTYGNYIKIRHDDGYETIYAHCHKLIAKAGQKVKQGDAIATVGNTGASVGKHLHFEIRKDGKALNPLDYINVPVRT